MQRTALLTGLLILTSLGCQLTTLFTSQEQTTPSSPTPVESIGAPTNVALVEPITTRVTTLVATESPAAPAGVARTNTPAVRATATKTTVAAIATNTPKLTIAPTPSNTRPAGASPTATGAPTGCPALPPPNAKPSGIVKGVTMAQGATSDTGEPVNPTTEFRVNSIAHAIVAIQNAPANTKVKTMWYANDVGNAAPCNTLIGEAELTEVVGSTNLDFQQGPIAPVGTFRVEVYVNGTMDRVANFSVK